MNFSEIMKSALNNYVVFLVVSGCLLIAFLIINLAINLYARDLKKIQKAIKTLKATKNESFAAELPIEYRFMWHSYLASQNKYPRDFFRFVKKRQKSYGGIAAIFVVVAVMAAAVYSIASGAINGALVICAGFQALFLGTALLAVRVNHYSRERKASLIVARMIGYMDTVFGKSKGQKQPCEIDEKATDELIDKIKFLREGGVPEMNAQKIASLLSGEKLSQERTVEQQKKLNEALNGLVQVVSYTNKS